MCRMFAVLSTKPAKASTYLYEAQFSLYRQAKKGNQGDGCGIGYYVDGRPMLVKSEKAIYEARDFVRLSSGIVSNLFIAHVRKASNPKSLPREVLISESNSQPFQHGDFLFVHNGTLFIPDEVTKILGDYRSVVMGVNDSEVLFALLLQTIERCGSVEEALGKLEPTLWEVHRRSGSNRPAPYRGLNIILSDGRTLYAYEKYVGDCGTSICSDTPVFEMQYRATDSEMVVASERMTQGDWKRLPNGGLLVARLSDDRVVLETRTLG